MTMSIDVGALADIDYSKGAPIVALKVDDHQLVVSLTVEHLARLVLDPAAAEDPAAATGDARLSAYAEIRAQVQRLIEGRKKKNALAYSDYLYRGVTGDIENWVVPPIELYTEKDLDVLAGPLGANLAVLPHGIWMVAIDGETQILAWFRNLDRLQDRGLLDVKIPVVIHHGKSVEWARQAFHDLNVLGVRPNTAVGISMDNRDFATRLTRRLMGESPLLKDRVEERRRQLRRKDPALVTISGLRQGITATILGPSGLEVGARPMPDLDDDVDPDALADEVIDLWLDILEALEDAFVDETGQRRTDTMVSAPSVLAAIGIVGKKVLDEEDSREEMLETLSEITWGREIVKGNRRYLPWLDVGGKLTSTGKFSVGGPKEYAHSLANALLNPLSKGGKQIRGIDLGDVEFPLEDKTSSDQQA
jgi:DGQHR domain-containing protein